MPFIEILLPTGHREKVEVNSNTNLINVLEDVCAKKGFLVDNCYLNYNKIKVDLSAKFGQSRLINNSKLDLIESETSLVENATVDVSLQSQNMSRINNTFCPKESLFSILESFCKLHPQLESCIFPGQSDLTPVIIHLHDQIVGNYCLKNTTLASLGLRSGRVLFRLEFKKLDESEKLVFEEITRKRIDKCLLGEVLRQEKEQAKLIKPEVKLVEFVPPPSAPFFVSQPTPLDCEILSSNDYAPFSNFSSCNQSIFDTDRAKPEAKVQQKPSQSLGEMLGLNLEPQQSNFDNGTSPFMNFKFPETSNDSKTLAKKREEEEEQVKRVSNEDRESVLYHRKPTVNIANTDVSTDDTSDTFFELTQQDLRNVIQSYRAVAESDGQLMTNKMREHLREARYAKYQRCIIQFQFPDSYILQSVFKPRETVGDLYHFVNQFFRNKNSNFHLYTTPPKDILKNKEKTLIQAELAPMCKVYVSVAAHSLSTDIDSLLLGDVIKAREVVDKWMAREEDEEPRATAGTSKSTSGNAHKMPKWFKSGR